MAPLGAEMWSVRDVVAHVAAWIAEANDRVPRALLGVPSVAYDVDAFNRDAIAVAEAWTWEQTLAAFSRAADRFEAIIGESDPADLLDSEDAMRWIESVAIEVMNEHSEELPTQRRCAPMRDA